MSEEIIKVLDDLGKRFGIAIDWTSANVVPYLKDLGQRFITYKTLTAILAIIICIILLIVGVRTLKKLIKWPESEQFDEYSEDGVLFGLGLVFSVVAIIGAIIAIICNLEGIIQNICMPELTIIEYLKNIGG